MRSPERALTTDLPARDDAAIRALCAELNNRWAQGDAAGHASLFTEDAEYVAFDGTSARGPQAIAEMHRPLFEGFLRGSRIEGEISSIVYPGPDVAVLRFRGAILKKGQEKVSRARLSVAMLVAVRDGARWRLAAFQNTRYRPFTETLLGRVLSLFQPRRA